jgi:hypothetical protein
MNDHQHAAIEQARIAWHDHQFEHDCYGRDCAEDRSLYRAYRRAINCDLPRPGPAARPPPAPAAPPLALVRARA